MKNHLYLLTAFLLFSFCGKTLAQEGPTFTITVGGKAVSSVCLGLAPSFTCTSGATDVSWDLGNGKTSTGTTTGYKYEAAGTYTVTIKDNGTGLSSQKTLVVNDVPKASYSVSSATGCTGSPITFTSTSTSASPIVLQKWDFGDGSGSSTTTPSTQYSFNTSGTFTPTLIVQDQNGCTGTSIDNQDIKIGGSDIQVSFQANGNQFYSCGNSISFSNTTNENGKTGIGYVWDFGDNAGSNQKAPGNHTYSQAGAYKVSLKASYGGNTGCAPGFSKTVYIGQPQITVNTPGSVCAFSTFNLNADVSTPGFVNSPADLNWQITNGNILNGGTSAYFNNVAGSNNISVTNVNGCPNTTTKATVVKAAPQFYLSMTPGSGICVETMTSAKAVFSDNSAANDIASYKWDPGDGSAIVTDKVGSVNHLYQAPGSYTLSLAATNTTGCTFTSQTPVSVKEDCTDNGYGSTYNPVFSFYSKDCEDKYTVIIKNKYPTQHVKEWIIDGKAYPAVNDSATAVLAPPVPDTATKKYEVQTIFQDGSSDKKQIEIINEKANFAVINTQNATRYCANNVFSFNTDTSLHVQNISSFVWTIADTSSQAPAILNGNNPTFTFPKPGTYSATLTISDIRTLPCTSTITKTIAVKGLSINLSADDSSFCYTNPTIKLTTQIVKSDAPVQYVKWNMGDGTRISALTSTTDTTFSFPYNYTGGSNQVSYGIGVEAGDTSGCVVSFSKAGFINIYDPKVSFGTADTLLCSRKKITINNTSNVPNGTYLWRVGDFEKTYKNRSGFNNTFTSIPNPSTMDVYLKVTDGGGCTKDTLVKNYLRFAQPKAAFGISNPELLQECPPYTLILKNNSINFNAVQWNIATDYSNGNYTQPDSIYYTPRHPGTARILLKTSLDGCVDSISDNITVKGPVARLAILDTLGCTPFTSRMAIHHNDDIAGYQWDFGDGNTIVSASADSLAHSYKTAGTFVPRILVLGKEGCTDSLDIPHPIVASHLSPTFSAFNVMDKCSLDTPKFLNTTPPVVMPVKQFIWNWGPGIKEENPTRDTLPHLFAATAMYIPVSLTAVTDYCTATSDTLTVSPHFANNVAIVGKDAICDNQRLYLTGMATQTPDRNNRYNWYNQYDSLIYSGTDSIIDLPMSPAFGKQIKLKITTALGCTNSTVQNIKTLLSPLILLQDSTKLCRGDSVPIQANANGTFVWMSKGGLVNGNTPSPTVFPDTSTYYYVKVTNSDNCTAQDSIWTQVDYRIGTSYQDSYKACLGDTAPIRINVDTKLPAVFRWDALPVDNNLNGITLPGISVSPHQNTTYHFVAYSKNVCPDETGDISLQYAPSPTIHFPGKTITEPAGTVFTLNPEIQDLTPGTKFTWYPDIRLDNRYLQNPTVVADKDITYTLRLLDVYGCTTSDSISIKVLCNASKILMANAFTPNGDGKNDRFYVTGYGIRNVVHFMVIDRWGKKVFEKNNVAANDTNQGWDGTVNGKPAEPGAYMYIAELECTEGNKIPVKGSVVLIR